jgi:hypothetical protein
MIVKINLINHEILDSDIPLNEGINIIGSIHAVSSRNNILTVAKNDLTSDFLSSPDLLDGDYILIEIRNGRFLRATVGTNIEKDLFYFLDRRMIVLSDDFWKITRILKKVTIDKNAEHFFISHGYFRPAETFFREIRRSRVLTYLSFVDSKIVEQSIYDDRSKMCSITYEAFKASLDSVFDTYEPSNNDCILLSGGVDSGLITALAFIRKNASPKLASMIYDPLMTKNNQDFDGAEKVANFYGTDLSKTTVDFNNITKDILDEVVKLMPLSAHLSFGFLALMNLARSKLSSSRIWCGQNADNLYNLGPTGEFKIYPPKGWGQAFKRFLLSKVYICSLEDVKPVGGFGARLLGTLINATFSLKERKRYRLPRTASELAEAFRESDSYTPLLESGLHPSVMDKSIRKFKTTLEVRNILFDEKVQSYSIGGDSRIIISSSNLNSLQYVLPYSCANMVRFFRNMELSWKDVFYRKHYIIKYLCELLGKHNFSNLYGKKENMGSGMNYKDWQKYIIMNTRLGSLIRENGDNESDVYSIQRFLSLFWKNQVFDCLNGMGVMIGG